MNLSEVRDLIRAEANIKGLGEYTTLIDNLINQELQRITGTAPYAELITEFTYTWTTEGQHEFDLPVNFQLLDRIIYTIPGQFWNPYPLDKGFARGFQLRQMGRPQFYHRCGNKLRIYPYTDSYIGDLLTLSYYKRPELLLDTDIFPVESLVAAVQQYVMARLLTMTNSKMAMITRNNANVAFIGSRAENAGN